MAKCISVWEKKITIGKINETSVGVWTLGLVMLYKTYSVKIKFRREKKNVEAWQFNDIKIDVLIFWFLLHNFKPVLWFRFYSFYFVYLLESCFIASNNFFPTLSFCLSIFFSLHVFPHIKY